METRFFWYCEDTLGAVITVSGQTVTIQNFVPENNVCTPFGKVSSVPYRVWQNFLISRCPPPTQSGINELLTELGLETYSVEGILRKTHGVIAGDNCRLVPEA